MEESRLADEFDRLRRLEAASDGVVSIADASRNNRSYRIRLRVNAPVGTNEQYRVEGEHDLSIYLPDDFPAKAPVVQFSHPILVPNIWPNGSPCIVELWMPSFHLDHLVCSVIEEMQGLSPNYSSVANREAGRLYAKPGFEQDLRRRLGPPVRLAPPPESASRGSEIQTLPPATAPGPATAGIRTISRPITTLPGSASATTPQR